MTSALIGHTGFVGSNLLHQVGFDDCFHSQNIESVAGNHYRLAVCAGARAEKWKINLNPGEDERNIERLINALRKTSIDEMILISTIDVYPSPFLVDEDSSVDFSLASPYGRHRMLLEQFVAETFPNYLIVRLPGLFGPGLKKNAIFDFLHNNQLEEIHAGSRYQFYPINRVWQDIEVARSHGVKLINFATEPVSVAELAREIFKIEFDNRPKKTPANYDFRTKFSTLWERNDGYIYGQPQLFSDLTEFVNIEKARR